MGNKERILPKKIREKKENGKERENFTEKNSRKKREWNEEFF